MPTISQAITEGAARLRAAGIDHERQTAGVLLRHVIGLDRAQLLTRSEQPIEHIQNEAYLALIERRAAGAPLQYLTGHQEFYGLDFMVTPDVLIPRPETEFLVERVITLIDELALDAPLIVDIGTGSGCIAVTLAVRLPRARLIATDASRAALEVARENAVRHGAVDRIELLEGDLFAPLSERRLEGAVDVLASNPPYVNYNNRDSLQREVRDWEPHAALFGGADGLSFYRRLLADGLKYVKPGGYLVVEIGCGQLEAICESIAASPWKLAEVTNDLQDIPRTLTIRKPMEDA